MILALRSDSPVAELYILDKDGKTVTEQRWPAGRELAAQLLSAIEDILKKTGIEWSSLSGLIIYEGPGSFTGLRIGVTVANALSYSLAIAIAGTGGNNWLIEGVSTLAGAEPGTYVMPHYGTPPHISAARK